MHSLHKRVLLLISTALFSGCGGLHTFREQPQNLNDGDVAIHIQANLDRAFVKKYLRMSGGDTALNAINTLSLIPDFHTSLKLKGFSNDRSRKQAAAEDPAQGRHKKMTPKATSRTHNQQYDWSESIYWGDNSFWFIGKADTDVSVFLIAGGTRNTYKGLVKLPINNQAVQTYTIIMNGESLRVNDQVLLPEKSSQ